jgi:predicted CXXCH cytochrome family protein
LRKEPEVSSGGWRAARCSASHLIASTLILLALEGAAAAAGKPHPSLIEPSTTKCASCHDVLAGEFRHYAALDGGCTNCHEFAKEEGATTVSLGSGEPHICLPCHDQLEHAGELAAPHAPVTGACTSCHDPHSSAEAKLLVEPVPSLCLACHDAKDLAETHTPAIGKSDCRLCHAPHGSDRRGMLAAAHEHSPFAERTCSACHRRGTIARSKPNVKSCAACHDTGAFSKRFVHTAVKRGECAGCHDPHLSDDPNLVRQRGARLCTGCHRELEARIARPNPHSPAQDDCTTCHHPHQSGNPRQLTAPLPQLCFGCHDQDDPDLRAKHLNSVENADCLTCHHRHGSTGPSLLLSRSVHPDFRGSCGTCHEGRSADRFTASSRQELCVACHSDVAATAQNAARVHPAMEAAECTLCHTPHAARQDRLVRFPGGGECADCHGDKGPSAGEVAHGAVGFLGCRGCHEPHGGARAALLRAEGDHLCLGCHEAAARHVDGDGNVTLFDHFVLSEDDAAAALRTPLVVRSGDHVGDHPLAGHRATGEPTAAELARTSTTFRGELRCVTCHDPHKGPTKNHFINNVATASELCLGCHRK